MIKKDYRNSDSHIFICTSHEHNCERLHAVVVQAPCREVLQGWLIHCQ